jgi:hypothetical protein
MSKKGHKGRSRKKSSVAERRPDVAVAPLAGGAEVVESAPAFESQPSPSLGPAVVERQQPQAEASAPVVSTSVETPIAFEAPPLVAESADGSLSPLSSDTSADLDSHFFNSHAPPPVAFDDHEEPERDPRMVLKLAPATARRRAQLQRYVRFAVAAASVLCLAALVKVAVAHNHEDPATVGRRASASMQVAPPPPAQPVETSQPAALAAEIPAPPPPATPETAPAATVSAAAASAEPAAEPTPAPSAAPAVTDTAAAAAPDPAVIEPDPKAAAKEKHDSQLALERGKVGDAIDAGERSVALDPSDAEAWLILGAAYQEKGDQKNARRSFKACLEQGKRGPKWECAQFPH